VQFLHYQDDNDDDDDDDEGSAHLWNYCIFIGDYTASYPEISSHIKLFISNLERSISAAADAERQDDSRPIGVSSVKMLLEVTFIWTQTNCKHVLSVEASTRLTWQPVMFTNSTVRLQHVSS
jgi:hypothetical protein